MAKYICLDKELDKSRYDQLKAMDEGFEIVLFNTRLEHEYSENIEHTEIYKLFRLIHANMVMSEINVSYDNMSFSYVYDAGQINDVILNLVLSDTEINLTIDISLNDLEELSNNVEQLSLKCRSSLNIRDAIDHINEELDLYSSEIEDDINFTKLQNALDCELDLNSLISKCHQEIYDTFMKYEHTPTA